MAFVDGVQKRVVKERINDEERYFGLGTKMLVEREKYEAERRKTAVKAQKSLTSTGDTCFLRREFVLACQM